MARATPAQHKVSYEKRREYYIAETARRRRELFQEVQQIKAVTPCTDCGIQYPFYVMQFDHVRGKKVGNIGTLCTAGARTKVFEEIEKCEVVCANCHFERTWQRNLVDVI